MNIYLINIIVIVVLGMIQENNGLTLIINKRRYRIGTALIVLTNFLLMAVEMGMRGDFSVDTINYYSIFFTNSANREGFSGGFSFFNILMRIFPQSQRGYLYFLIAIGMVIAFSYTKFMISNSELFWMSALLLFCGGSFYTGFNVMRQVMAASLIALSYKYIFEKKFIKFCISVLIISTFHLSAIIMIPIYFVLTYRWEFARYRYVKILSIALMCILAYFFTPMLFNLLSRYMYTTYHSSSAYGVSEGIGFLGTLKAIILAGGVIINSKYFDKSNIRDRVIYNGSVLYLIIAVCGANIFIIQRFTHYFVPCLLIAYPHIICQIQSSKSRFLYKCVITLLFIISGINMVLNPDYYFYWNNKTISWG